MSDNASGLRYRVIQPTEGDPPHPAVFLLHGRGSNEDDLLSLGPLLDPRLVVVSPRAPHVFGPGSFYWYDLEAAMVGRPSLDDITNSLSLVFRLIDECLTTVQLDGARLFLGGFSMGGAMTAAATLLEPQRFAGSMILSGYVPIHTPLPFRLTEAAGKPVFQAHGIYDDVLPIQYGRASRDFLVEAGVALTYREYPMRHQVSDSELNDVRGWIKDLI